MSTLGWVDWTMAAILAASVLVGIMRGLTLELLSLAGWVVALIAAQWFAPTVAPSLPIGTAESPLRYGASFALLFFGALLVWGLLSRLLAMLIKASPLSGIDRLLGAGFGALRALVLLIALAFIVGLTPWSRSPEWQASRGADWLAVVVHGLSPYLPDALARRLPGRA